MDLMGAAWMVRELGEPVSAIHVLADGGIIAGGWDGILKHWDVEGDLIWKVDCDDRIESILINQDRTIVTSGLHITCIKEGSIEWSHALEGSSDMLCMHKGKVIATSSVYDIEHGDFMESAIWRFELDGELIDVERMDERPWFIESTKELLLALGRPRCGLLEGKKHRSLATEHPVTCGISGRERTLLGHSDGTISSSKGKLISSEEDSIDSIICTDYGFVASIEGGTLIARNPAAEPLWSARGSQVICHTEGFSSTHWTGRFETIDGILEIRGPDGEMIASMRTSRPRVANSNQNRVAFGFEDGKVVVWEKELFDRRIDSEESEVDDRKSRLAERLRSLRS